MSDIWFSDIASAVPAPYCLVCWAYGRVRIQHKAAAR